MRYAIKRRKLPPWPGSFLSGPRAFFIGAKVAREKTSVALLRPRTAFNGATRPRCATERAYLFLVVFFLFGDRLAAFFFFAMAQSPPFS
jgi:hypothetical protein